MTELHLTDEQLAALADDSMSETDRALLTEHVRSCQACHETFLDAIRYRAILLADASVFRAPDEAIRLARAVAKGAQAGSPAPARRRPWFSARPALAGLAAAGIALAAFAVWQSGIVGRDRYDHYFSPLRQAALSASVEGSIVLPGPRKPPR